jgi:hypothetical protein
MDNFVPYTLKNENITEDDINNIIKNKNTYVYVKNNNFCDDFNKLPIYVKHLEIINLQNSLIPTHIKWLYVYNFNNRFIIHPTIKILEFRYCNENDFDILNLIPYGIESIIIHMSTNNRSSIDLDMLPDSIKSIHFVNNNNTNFKIKLNKIYSKLQWIYYNKYKVINHCDILEYLNKNYENKEILQDDTNILLFDIFYNDIMMAD